MLKKELICLFLLFVLLTSCIYAQDRPKTEQKYGEWVFGEVVAKDDSSISIEYLDFDLDDYQVMVLGIDRENSTICDQVNITDIVSIFYIKQEDGSLKVEKIKLENLVSGEQEN